MADHILKLAHDFWNVRGSFRVRGLPLNVGTHTSLVRRPSGRFLLLDSYGWSDEVDAEIRAQTEDGAAIEAILNLHPFHTVHVQSVHERFPHAALYGTDRHVDRKPDLPWQPERTNDPALHERFADTLEFTVPRGVPLVHGNPQIHFSSVLAYHPSSRALHVDDTLNWVPLLGWLRFHNTLAKALEPRAGAVGEFRAWSAELLRRWPDIEHLCAAHVAALPADKNRGPSIAERIQKARVAAERTLRRHERRYG